MSLWEQTNAFSFAPDFERKQAAPPQPAWTAKRVAITATSESAESLVATMVFAVYSKFEGDDAVLVVDGRPPTAIVNPFAALAEAPFTAALAEVTTARESTDPRADEMRKKIAKVLKERSQATTTDANRTTAIVGSGAVLLQRTVDHIGEVAAVHAFDSIFVLDEGVDEATFEVSILYNASIYASQTMEDRMDLLEMVRDAHAVNPAFVLRTDVSALTESMKLRLLRDWQPERIPVHIYHRTLPDVFIETVNERCGDPRVKHAVIEPSTGRTITYADMLLRARKLACYLQRKVPCDSWGSDATCGIHVPRCLDWYVMMLGVHLAGGAYLSLDPDFPPDRLLYTLQDSGAVCLLTLRSMVGSLGYEGPTFAVDELWSEIDEEDVPADFASPSTGTSPAYLIYTSGSTGKPKGVCIEHRNAVNFVESERRLFGIDNHHRVIQGFSTSFDASVEEIWLAFASGSSLVVVDKAVMQDADMLGQLVLSTQATILSTVPTLLATMDSKKVASLEMVIAGGEACNKDVVKAYATGGKRRFVNSYGPTEATVACMADFSTPDRPVTIGRPQPGYFACIVNERMELLPPGVPGELCMAGPSVARGYVNRPDLTEEKFCPCPYQSIPRDAFDAYDDATANDATFDRLYHTGDLTRWNIDGRVEFLGRIDSQVKLRGFRIEVGEIEAHLANFPGVKSAVVHLLQDNGHDYLCGYLMCDQTLTQNFQEHAFKDFLKDKLPTYMIPSRFCTVESYPRSPAGKLDRKQLPPPPPVAKQESDEPAKGGAPKNATERLVYDIWVELFPGMKLGTGDNFFEIGGHSLLAGKLASKIRQCGYQSFNIRMVYANPTVAEIAEALSKMERVNVVDETGASEVLRLPERFQPSLLRKTLFALWQMTFFTIGGIFSWAWLIIFALFVTLVEGPDSGASTWLEDRLNLYDIVVYGVIMQCIASIWSLFSMLVVAPIMKWVILGRAKPGMYSIWSFYYLRYWTSRSFTSNSFMLLSTEVHNLQLRSLGAKIGGSTIISAFIQDPDLVEIGEDCFIGDNVTLQTSQVVDSMLVLQPVTIGNCCSVGARSVISGGAVLEDEVMTVPLTVIPPNVIISSGEKWQGAPASRAGRTMPLSTMMDSTTRRGRPSEQSFLMLGSERAIHLSVCRRIGMGLMQFFFLFAVGLVSGGGVSGFFSLVMLNHMLIWGNHWYIVLLVMLSPVITGILMVWGHVWLVFLRYVVFPRTPVAGLYAIDSQMFQRKILFDIIARSSLMGAHPMYGSIFTQYYLRAMGCKVGRRVECSNLWGWTPGLTNFGDECFVADFVGVNPPEVFRGVMRLDKVDIGFRAFIGNGSVLPPGTVVEEKSLLGLASIPPNGRVYAGTTAIGSPAFEIPRKTSVDSVDQQRTFEPPRSLVIRRVIWETFRCVMPSTFITWSFMYAFMLLVFVFEDHSYVADGIASGKFVIILLLYVVFLWTNLLFSVFFAVASKWLIVGQHKAEENPLWSPGVWRSEFVVDVTTVVGGGGPIGFFRGTQFLCILFRMLGAKIGKECFVDTLYLTEPDLVTLGDGVCVNFNATLQTHLFEDRVMKMDTMEIKDRASVGCFAVVLYNTVVGRGCTIAPNTLVMKGESLPNYTHWQGSPAQKGQIPEVMRTTEAESEQTVRLNIVPTLPRAEAPASPNVAGAGLRSTAEWLARSRRRSSNAAPLSKSFGEPSSGAL